MLTSIRHATLLVCLFALGAASARAQRPTPDFADVQYAEAGGVKLLLDVYLPKNVAGPYPVIVWVHGGGWTSGSKDAPNGTFMLAEGFALVSINYRLSGEAQFPAQIHDCKAAVRWMRANAGTYGFDPDRIGAFGSSAGGHLVAMLGTAGGVAELEGSVGGNAAYSSSVQAVCDWYGPSNLITMGDYPSGLDHRSATSPEGSLIGGAILDNPEKARAASPITYVSEDDPPFLIQHGTADNTVPFHQSVELDSALRGVGVDATFIPIVDGTHGGGFNVDTVRSRVIAFFKRVLGTRQSGVAGADAPNDVGVAVLPNPIHGAGIVQATTPNEERATLEIFDAMGCVLVRRDLGVLAAGVHRLPIDVGEALPAASGVYLLRLRCGAAVATTRVCVVR